MILSSLLLVVGPLVLGIATAWLLAGIVPLRRLSLAAGSIAVLGLGLHLVLALSEVTDARTNHTLAAGHRYVLAVLIATLFFTKVLHIGRPARAVPAAKDAKLDRCERARLASSLHDTVGQGLAVIVMQLRNVERETHPSGTLGVIDSTARETMGEVRRLIGDLRRPGGAVGETVFDADAPSVLNRFHAAGLAVQLSIRGREADVPREVHAAVIRVLREALTNALKYAADEPVAVELTVAEQVVLRVRSGLGGNKTSALAEDCWQGGEGMRGLTDLVGRHCGMLRFGPGPDGFEVLAVVPLSGDRSVLDTTTTVGFELVSAAC